jgi:hypothetical protein
MLNEYRRRLNFFAQMLNKFIEPEDIEILKGKISGLIVTPPDKKNDGRWNFSISSSYPLKFHPCNLNGNKIQVDFSCIIEGRIPSLKNRETTVWDALEKYNVLIRVWSLEDKLSFRDEFDSETVRDLLQANDQRRVILRFHIDQKFQKVEIEEPYYHLHFGGIAHENELAWYPRSFDSPRFYFIPLDIVLATEFILMNFFSIKSYKLREDPEWKSIVMTAQELFLKPCIYKYYQFVNDESASFLNHSVSWN